MLKFFGRIRYRQMELGKTPQYLKYAIGEIILVVVGILIALSINNWNEGRKELVKEQKVLIQLKAEYKSNLEQLEDKMDMHSEIIHASIELLGYIDNPTNIKRDSIIKYLSFLSLDPTFDPIQNDLINSGNIRLIKNDQLKQSLTAWPSEVQQLQEVELSWQKVIIQQFIPLGMKFGIIRDVTDNMWKSSETAIYLLDKNSKMKLSIGKSKAIWPILDLLQNKEIEGVISLAINYNHVSNLNALALREKIIEILNLIETQLND